MPCPTYRFLSACIVVCFPLLVATAPPDAAAQQPKTAKEKIKGTGTLKGFRGNLLHVQTKEGDQYLVKVEAKPQDIVFSGSADSSWLRPGMLVRFTCRFNKKGEAQTAVSNLTVFTPREGTKIGVFADLNAGAKDLFSSDDEKSAKAPSVAFLVAGRLTAFRNGKMTVAAGRTSVKTELADKAVIKIDVADLRLAKPGDTVRFDGWYYPQRKQEIYATRLEVAAAEPIRGVKKPSAPSRASNKPEEPGEKKPSDEEPGA